MKKYKYTQNWFNESELKKILVPGKTDEYHILEIGSFEGLSTIWFIENMLSHPKSKISCIDPWTNYSQTANSANSYNNPKAEWKLGNLNIQQTFNHNISESGHKNKVEVLKGLSNKILPRLINNSRKYDLIFIDGNHTAPFVLSDSVLSWQLLKKGGVMIFDDYIWGVGKKPTLTPKLAIDSFISIYSDYAKVIFEGNFKAIKRIN